MSEWITTDDFILSTWNFLKWKFQISLESLESPQHEILIDFQNLSRRHEKKKPENPLKGHRIPILSSWDLFTRHRNVLNYLIIVDRVPFRRHCSVIRKEVIRFAIWAREEIRLLWMSSSELHVDIIYCFLTTIHLEYSLVHQPARNWVSTLLQPYTSYTTRLSSADIAQQHNWSWKLHIKHSHHRATLYAFKTAEWAEISERKIMCMNVESNNKLQWEKRFKRKFPPKWKKKNICWSCFECSCVEGGKELSYWREIPSWVREKLLDFLM